MLIAWYATADTLIIQHIILTLFFPPFIPFFLRWVLSYELVCESSCSSTWTIRRQYLLSRWSLLFHRLGRNGRLYIAEQDRIRIFFIKIKYFSKFYNVAIDESSKIRHRVRHKKKERFCAKTTISILIYWVLTPIKYCKKWNILLKTWRESQLKYILSFTYLGERVGV